MGDDGQPEFASAPQASTRVRAESAQRLQFSVSSLLLAMLFIGIACTVVRMFGSVWLVPTSLAALSAANLTLAVYRKLHWRMLKLGYWHFAIWLACAAVASHLAVRGCRDYNVVAGTDKTGWHIVQISAAVLAGPMVGPVANEGAGEAPQAWRWTAILFTIQCIAAAPFLFVRQVAPLAVALFCWLTFVAATILWFFGAMISLAIFLS